MGRSLGETLLVQWGDLVDLIFNVYVFQRVYFLFLRGLPSHKRRVGLGGFFVRCPLGHSILIDMKPSLYSCGSEFRKKKKERKEETKREVYSTSYSSAPTSEELTSR